MKWPWRTKGPAHDSLDALWKAVEDVQTCCGNTREAMVEVKRQTSAMEADVSLMWEKTNRALQRFAKRESRDQGNGEPELTDEQSRFEELSRKILNGEPL